MDFVEVVEPSPKPITSQAPEGDRETNYDRGPEEGNEMLAQKMMATCSEKSGCTANLILVNGNGIAVKAFPPRHLLENARCARHLVESFRDKIRGLPTDYRMIQLWMQVGEQRAAISPETALHEGVIVQMSF
jgi:hypothetical protein